MRVRSRTFTLRKYIGLILCANILSTTFTAILCVVKVIYPQEAIGTNKLVSWMYSLGYVFMVVTVHFLIALYISVSLQQEKYIVQHTGILRLLFFVKYIYPIFMGITACADCLPIVASFLIPVQDQIFQAFWLTQGSGNIFFGFAIPFSLQAACRDLKKIIEDSSKNPATSNPSLIELAKDVYVKFNQARVQTIIRCIINVAIYFPFGLIPAARYWSPYLMGLQNMFFPSINYAALKTCIQRKQNSNSQSNNPAKSEENLMKSSSNKVAVAALDDSRSSREQPIKVNN